MRNIRKLRTKILFAAGLPSILAFVFIFLAIMDKYSVYRDMTEVEALSGVASENGK